MPIALIPSAQHRDVEATLTHADSAVAGVPESQADPVFGLHFLEADDFAPCDDFALPLALVGLVQALVIHVLVHPVEQLGSDDAVVCGFVVGVCFLAGLGGEVVEGVDAVGVEDLVDAVLKDGVSACWIMGRL